VPYGGEISRDGFKLLLELCKTFRRRSRLVRCARECRALSHVHCLANIIPPGKRAAGTGQKQKQKHENCRSTRFPPGNGRRGRVIFNTCGRIVFNSCGRIVFQEKTRSWRATKQMAHSLWNQLASLGTFFSALTHYRKSGNSKLVPGRCATHLWTCGCARRQGHVCANRLTDPCFQQP